MSNVTAVLECPGCQAILEAEERPNIDWKLGTTRIVLVPEQTAIEHFFECLDFARSDLDPVIPGPAEESRPFGAVIIEGASPDVVILDETGSFEVVLPVGSAPAEEPPAPATEPTENVEETAPADTKPAPKRRTSK